MSVLEIKQRLSRLSAREQREVQIYLHQLRRLPRPARLKIAEPLWDSVATDALRAPASHKSLIRGRRAAYAQGKMRTLTMPELKRSVRRRS